jgi:hypothetical protein
MPRKYKSASEHLDAIECAIQVAPKHLTTKEVAVLCDIDPKRACAFLAILARKNRVHSIPSGLSNNGKAWAMGPAPQPVAVVHEEDDKPCNVLPVRRFITSTWDAIKLRDPLVTALFGAPQVAA